MMVFADELVQDVFSVPSAAAKASTLENNVYELGPVPELPIAMETVWPFMFKTKPVAAVMVMVVKLDALQLLELYLALDETPANPTRANWATLTFAPVVVAFKGLAAIPDHELGHVASCP